MHLSEEHGEVVRAVTKNEGKQSMQEELIDLIVVAWRMLRDEHEHTDCDECKFLCEGCANRSRQC